MTNIIQKIINKIKGSEEYVFQENIKLSDLANIIFLRALQIIRGLFLKIFLWNVKGLFFLGRGVKIDFKKSIYAGKNLILEDRVYINGLSKNGIHFGENCTVGREAIILSTGVIRNLGEGVRIGSNTAIGARNFISGQGGINIGSDVIMGPDIRIFSENHNFLNSSDIIKNQGENRKGVKIGDNCWIGANVTILDGVNLGNNSIIAAGSVVNQSFKSDVLIGGVPAKILKNLDKELGDKCD
jgi:acetyltransferase-like isoleucine patch superfamily enzyme